MPARRHPRAPAALGTIVLLGAQLEEELSWTLRTTAVVISSGRNEAGYVDGAMSLVGPRPPSSASAWNGSYLRISCRHWGRRTTAEDDPKLPSIDNRHARPTTTAPHLDSNQKEPGAHVIGPAGFPSIADVTALFCGGACRIAPSSAGGLPALCPADLQI